MTKIIDLKNAKKGDFITLPAMKVVRHEDGVIEVEGLGLLRDKWKSLGAKCHRGAPEFPLEWADAAEALRAGKVVQCGAGEFLKGAEGLILKMEEDGELMVCLYEGNSWARYRSSWFALAGYMFRIVEEDPKR